MSKEKTEQINRETRAQKEYNDEYREYQAIFRSISGELGQQVSHAKSAKKEYQNLASISRKLSDSQKEGNRIADKDLENLQKRAQSSADQITADIAGVKELVKNKQELSIEDQALLAAGEANQIQEKQFLEDIKAQIELRKESNKAMGVAGGLLKGLNEIAGPFAKALNLDKVEKDMQKVADRVAEGNEAFGKMKVLAAGVGSAITSAFDTVTDPSVVLGSIIKSFKELGKSQREFRQQTGQNADNFSNMNDSLATSTDLIKASTMLSKELGVNANVIFDKDTVLEVAELTEFMGLGAKEAANLAKFAKLSGKELSTVTAEIESSFKSFVKTNKTGLNIKDVMEGVGNASAAVTISLGSQPAKIQEAVMEAGKLGLSLEQVDKIAGSLLDFESSISAEMEAELHTGKQLNLEKARQLALNNDLAGVAVEIGKNQAILSAFSSGNRIAQEATAKAMGMSREEMAKMIYQQQLRNGLTDEQAAKAADISLEEAKRLDTQKQIQKSLEKMSQAAATILDFFAPILSNSVVLFGVVASIGVIMTAKILTGLKGSVGEMKSLVKGSIAFLKNSRLTEALLGKKFGGGQFMTGGGQAKAGGQRAGGLVGKVKGMFSKGGNKKITGGGSLLSKILPSSADKDMKKAGEGLGGLSEKTKGVKPGLGKTIKNFLKSIGQGLSAFGKAIKGPQLAYIAAGMGILTLSLIGMGYALKLAAPGIKAFGVVITSIFAGVGTVITAVADGFVKLMGAISMENIGPLLLLGPALLGISAGLASMAVTGIMALPAIAGLVALSLVAAPLIRLAELGVIGDGGGRGDEGNNKDSMIADKLDQLIAVVERGGDIFLDGAKVGRNLAIASSKIG